MVFGRACQEPHGDKASCFLLLYLYSDRVPFSYDDDGRPYGPFFPNSSAYNTTEQKAFLLEWNRNSTAVEELPFSTNTKRAAITITRRIRKQFNEEQEVVKHKYCRGEGRGRSVNAVTGGDDTFRAAVRFPGA